MKSPFLISKVERAEAIDNIDEIVEQSDALMVARGDMGVEDPLKRVPQIQKDLNRLFLNCAIIFSESEDILCIVQHCIIIRA